LEAYVKRLGIVSLMLLLTSGCVVVGGYSSGRGWFLWPGTIVIFLVVAVLFLLLRRRGWVVRRAPRVVTPRRNL